MTPTATRRAVPRPHLGVPRAPLYPAIVTASFVLFDYAASNVSLEALWRPLAVAMVVTIAVQAALSLIARSADTGAYVTLVLQFGLFGIVPISLVLVGWLLVAVVIAFRRGRGVRLIPWLRATRVLNVVAILMLVQVVVTSAFNGAFVFSDQSWSVARGQAPAGTPDVYLIMLDGYPRADTLETRFGLDDSGFLGSMQSMGFDVASQAHSNYDATVLTLASFFNGSQIPSLLPNPPQSRSQQFRALTHLINQGTQLQGFRQAGYEIVSVPSEYFEGAIVDADRNLGTGQLSSFEMQLLQTGTLRNALGGIEKTWFPAEHRARIFDQFATLEGLAAERGGNPKVVFSHFLVPHMPIAFNSDGSASPGLSCFPMSCTLFTYGDQYRADTLDGVRDQITWLNGAISQVVRDIQAKSAVPPVIVIFSDHGTRFWQDDHGEMYRSLFLAATPGHPDLFPDDTTPVNVLARLRNAYTGANVALATEELYWLDTRTIDVTGLMSLERVDRPADLDD